LNRHLQFLNHVIIIETKALFPQAYDDLSDCVYPVYALWLSCSQRLLNYLAFKYFSFERT
jgi:hypothetical protein